MKFSSINNLDLDLGIFGMVTLGNFGWLHSVTAAASPSQPSAEMFGAASLGLRRP